MMFLWVYNALVWAQLVVFLSFSFASNRWDWAAVITGKPIIFVPNLFLPFPEHLLLSILMHEWQSRTELHLVRQNIKDWMLYLWQCQMNDIHWNTRGQICNWALQYYRYLIVVITALNRFIYRIGDLTLCSAALYTSQRKMEHSIKRDGIICNKARSASNMRHNKRFTHQSVDETFCQYLKPPWPNSMILNIW